MNCAHCCAPMTTHTHRVSGLPYHAGRGLCHRCYWHLSNRGELDTYERKGWPRAALLAEWDLLRADGVARPAAAERIGVTDEALYQAIRRERRRTG